MTAPDHLVALPDSDFRLWRSFCLRGAGFPVNLIAGLAAPELSLAADKLGEAQERTEQLRLRLNERLQAEYPTRSDRERSPAAVELSSAICLAMNSLRKDRPAREVNLPPAVSAEAKSLLDELRRLEAEAERLNRDYLDAFPGYETSLCEALGVVSNEALFQEALLWQNPHAYASGLQSFLRHDTAAMNARKRQHAQMLASYLQRYTLKNDSIGFFGPIGFGIIDDSGPALVVRPGRTLLARRAAYFESWGLAEVMRRAGDPATLRPWLKPRRLHHFVVEGTTIRFPALEALAAAGTLPPGVATTATLTEFESRLLDRCDGGVPASELADREAAAGRGISGTEVMAALLKLLDRGLIRWDLETPVEARPEETLRAILAGVPDSTIAAPFIAALDRFTAARAAVAAAAGQPEQLALRLAELEAVYADLTGAAAKRDGGQTYAARTLIYEDCRRDLEIRIGPDLLGRLAPVLDLVFLSGRWYTNEVARAYRSAFAEVLASFPGAVGPIDLMRFMTAAQPLLTEEKPEPVQAVIRELQARWAEALGAFDPAARVCRFRSAEVRDRAERLFAAAGPGWTFARYTAPDLMLSAPSVEAFCRGEGLFVLGEYHLAPTLGTSCLLAQHPHPESLLEWRALDLPEACVIPAPSTELTPQRLVFRLFGPADWGLEHDQTLSALPRERVLSAADLVVERRSDRLAVRHRHGAPEFEIIDFFGFTLANRPCLAFPGFLPAAPHTPRVVIDDIVVSREAWRFGTAEMAFAAGKTEGERFRAARRWARTHGLPRHVFAKSPCETKPMYTDLTSPILVEMLAKWVRKLREAAPEKQMTVTEMLPAPEECWLPDASGRRYTCELRFIAVDPRPACME